MDKIKIILEWDDEKGDFKKYYLNKSLQQKTDDEEQYIVGQYIGWLSD